MKLNIKSMAALLIGAVFCFVGVANAEENRVTINDDKVSMASTDSSYGSIPAKRNYLNFDYSKDMNDYGVKPIPAFQRNITVWATGLPNRGARKNIYLLERGVRYKVRVSRFTHFGRWRPTKRDLKNDACYEFNARPRPVSLPVVKTNFGFNFCTRGYRANHVYDSQVIMGNGARLVMWVYDTDYRDNYGNYYVEVIQMASRR